MWTWIAERIKNDDGKHSEKLYKHVVYRMKREYLELYFPGEDVRAYCFCCEYTFNIHPNTLCAHCPIVWGDEDTNVETGCINLQSSPYRSLKYLIYPFDKRLAYNKALRIANLPERSEAEETDQDPDDGNPWSFIRCHVIVEGGGKIMSNVLVVKLDFKNAMTCYIQRLRCESLIHKEDENYGC